MQWLLIAGLMLFLWLGNNRILLTRRRFCSARLPAGFDGCRILHISDLHNKAFGKDQCRLLALAQKAAPDLVVITGDLIDKRRTRIDRMSPALELLAQIGGIAPTYFVGGNHEQTVPALDAKIRAALHAHGIPDLDDKGIVLSRNGDDLLLLGLRDITPQKADPAVVFPPILSALREQQEGFCILLSHRPDPLAVYAAAGVDLVFSGHAHGGQVRLPLLGGLYAPEQGMLPRYTCGLYRKDSTVMSVHRGLGNSLFPLRFCNFPELVLLTLHREE